MRAAATCALRCLSAAARAATSVLRLAIASALQNAARLLTLCAITQLVRRQTQLPRCRVRPCPLSLAPGSLKPAR